MLTNENREQSKDFHPKQHTEPELSAMQGFYSAELSIWHYNHKIRRCGISNILLIKCYRICRSNNLSLHHIDNRLKFCRSAAFIHIPKIGESNEAITVGKVARWPKFPSISS